MSAPWNNTDLTVDLRAFKAEGKKNLKHVNMDYPCSI